MPTLDQAFQDAVSIKTGSVAQLFINEIGPIHLMTEFTSLNDMPVDSSCGESCAKAIRAGKGLLKHTRAGFGEDFGISQQVRHITMRVCLVYICG